MRSTATPPAWRANSQLYSAVRTPPTCRKPVGDGAKRTRTDPRRPVSYGRRALRRARLVGRRRLAGTRARGRAGLRLLPGVHPELADLAPTQHSDEDVARFRELAARPRAAPSPRASTSSTSPRTTPRSTARASTRCATRRATPAGLGPRASSSTSARTRAAASTRPCRRSRRASRGPSSGSATTRGCCSRTRPAPATPSAATSSDLARVLEAVDHPRVGVCIDTCHIYVSGVDIRDRATRRTRFVERVDRELGLERLRCLHVNDSAAPLGSNRDRHANIGEGELGEHRRSSPTRACRACRRSWRRPGPRARAPTRAACRSSTACWRLGPAPDVHVAVVDPRPTRPPTTTSSAARSPRRARTSSC